MRVNVDVRIFEDPRARRCAELLGIGLEQLVGAMTRCWGVALTRVDYHNPTGIIDRTEANYISDLRAPLVDAMLETALARIEPDGRVYFAGLAERGAFLLKQRKNGGKGGKAKGERGKAKQPKSKAADTPKPTLSTGLPNANPTLSQVPEVANPVLAGKVSLISGSGSGSGSGSFSGSKSAPSAPDAETFALKPPPVARDKRAPLEGVTECIADFDERYRARTGGSRPTWGGKPGELMRRLIAAHGAPEVRKRIRVLFTSPPTFLAGSVPDVETLSQHFDKLAAPSTPPPMGPRPNAPSAGSIAPPTAPYRPPVVVNAVAPSEVANLAGDLLAKLRGGKS